MRKFFKTEIEEKLSKLCACALLRRLEIRRDNLISKNIADYTRFNQTKTLHFLISMIEIKQDKNHKVMRSSPAVCSLKIVLVKNLRT